MSLVFGNKKGSAIVDGLFIIVILTVLAISFGVLGNALSDVKGSIEGDMTDASANQSLQETATNMPSALDSLLLAVLVIAWAGAIILSFMIDTHPVFLGLAVILLIVIFLVGGYLSNAYVEINNDMGFATQFPKTNYIMTHLLEFVAAIVGSIFIALFAKSRTG